MPQVHVVRPVTCLVLFAITLSVAHAQGALVPLVSLREFASLTEEAEALGRLDDAAAALPAPSAEESVLYDYPGFASATVRAEGLDPFVVRARYNRGDSRVEVLHRGRVRALSPQEAPLVEIGERAYRAVAQMSNAKLTWVYGQVQATSPDGWYLAVKQYRVVGDGATARGAGIGIATSAPSYRLDSFTVLLGFRPLPVPAPAKKKALVRDLSRCGAAALEAAGRYRHNRDGYWRRFMAAIQPCDGAE